MSETIRVLIVEDLPTDAELSEREIQKALGSCKFRRVETREGYLAALDEFCPALIVSDYRLPHFDGMSALKLALERCPDVPFIILTGSMNEDTAVECMKAGAWDYVIKEHVKRLGPAVASALEEQGVRMRRKRAEESLVQINALLQRTFDAIPDLLTVHDRDLRVVLSNWHGRAHVTEEERNSRPHCYSCYMRRDRPCEPCPTLEVFRTGAPVATEMVNPHTGRILEVSAYPVTDASGAISLVTEHVRDITEGKQAETALRESETRFRDIFERSTIGKAISRQDGRLIEVNQAFADMLGFSIEEMQQITIAELTHPDDLVESLERVRSVITGKRTSLRMEKRYRHRDGHWVFADTSVTLLRNIPGTPPCLITSIVDISDRKRAEDELRFNNVVLATQQQTTLDGILVVDPNAKIISSNRRFAEMWGVPSDIMESGIDERALQWVMDRLADPEEFISKVRHLCATPDERSQDEVALKDGRTFDRYSAPMLDTGGTYLGRVWYFRDITERKRGEAALAAAYRELERQVADRTAELTVSNRELESFASSVSHDLRAPLRGIDGWSQAVLEDCGAQLDERGRTYLKSVRSETHRMGELIDGLLELSRVTRAPMKHETVDLTAMAQELEAGLRAGQPERAVDFVVAPAMVATGDAVLLRAALQNLLHNAWRFTGRRPRARIEVGCTSEPGRTVYHVRDDGAGFDMRYVGKLFAPFQRLHSLEEFPGTGIGLATVQRIIHRHGGKVWATAEVDQGATFYFTLTT